MKKEKCDQNLHFRISKSDLEELDMRAYLSDMSRSEYIRRALDVYFNLIKHAPNVIEEFEKNGG